jgi:hypothetical protein
MFRLAVLGSWCADTLRVWLWSRTQVKRKIETDWDSLQGLSWTICCLSKDTVQMRKRLRPE